MVRRFHRRFHDCRHQHLRRHGLPPELGWHEGFPPIHRWLPPGLQAGRRPPCGQDEQAGDEVGLQHPQAVLRDLHGDYVQLLPDWRAVRPQGGLGQVRHRRLRWVRRALPVRPVPLYVLRVRGRKREMRQLEPPVHRPLPGRAGAGTLEDCRQGEIQVPVHPHQGQLLQDLGQEGARTSFQARGRHPAARGGVGEEDQLDHREPRRLRQAARCHVRFPEGRADRPAGRLRHLQPGHRPDEDRSRQESAYGGTAQDGCVQRRRPGGLQLAPCRQGERRGCRHGAERFRTQPV